MNVTLSPSFSDLIPARSSAVACTTTSFEPSAGEMKPNPCGQKTETAGNTVSYPLPVQRFQRPVRYISMNAMVGAVRGPLLNWARVLAYVTGTVDQELLARNEYLAAE